MGKKLSLAFHLANTNSEGSILAFFFLTVLTECCNSTKSHFNQNNIQNE